MPFKKNISLLRKTDPGLANALDAVDIGTDISILDSRSGPKTIKCSGFALHSMYDPEKEAEQWAAHNHGKIENTPVLIVLGFGFGYHIKQLIKQTDAEIFVYEPRLDIIKAAMQSLDLTGVLKKIHVITDLTLPSVRKNFEILEYGPSINIDKNYYKEALNRIRTLKLIAKGLRVMVVGPIYGGSLPVARYCAEAFRNIGVEVDFFDSSIYSRAFFSVKEITTMTAHQNQLMDMLTAFISEAVIARCQEFMPDIVFALAQSPLNEIGLSKLRLSGIPTAFWFVEDFKTLEYWKITAPYYDYFFTIQKGDFIRQLNDLGLERVRYLPLAASTDVHRKIKLGNKERDFYGSDISFMGAGYYNRRKFFTGLMDFDLKIWGNEWDMSSPLNKFYQKSSERIDTKETVKIFNASKININLHSSTNHQGVDPFGDFVNPRTFEIAACGAFQLVDYRSELPALFDIGKELVCFEDINDIRKKIRYYLNNAEEREYFAEKSMQRVLHEHTYEHRMREALQFMIEHGLKLPSWSHEREDIKDMIAQAGADTALGEYLKKFRTEGSVSLDDIMKKIQKGKGDLDRTEKMFILLEEMRNVYCKKD